MGVAEGSGLACGELVELGEGDGVGAGIGDSTGVGVGETVGCRLICGEFIGFDDGVGSGFTEDV